MLKPEVLDGDQYAEVKLRSAKVGGTLAAKIDEQYPRRLYWDAFAARTRAHVVHFRDVPAMAGLSCPDEMHLDQRDQAAFTRALVDVMRERGALQGRP